MKLCPTRISSSPSTSSSTASGTPSPPCAPPKIDRRLPMDVVPVCRLAVPEVTEYTEPGRGLALAGEPPPSAGIDLASSGFEDIMAIMSCERCDVSRVRHWCHAASFSNSSRLPGKGAPALMFFKQVYYKYFSTFPCALRWVIVP